MSAEPGEGEAQAILAGRQPRKLRLGEFKLIVDRVEVAAGLIEYLPLCDSRVDSKLLSSCAAP